jgi:hypothetical protein
MGEKQKQATEVQIKIDLKTFKVCVTDDIGTKAEPVEINVGNPIKSVTKVMPATILVGHMSPGHIIICILGVCFKIPIPQ